MNDARMKRMGLDGSYVDSLQRDIADGMAIFGMYEDVVVDKGAKHQTVSSHFGRHHDIGVYFDVLYLRHLQVNVPGFEFPETICKTADLARDFFVGPWRDNAIVYHERCNREQCRKELDWLDDFRRGVLAALLSRHFDALGDICDYVRPDLPDDDGAWSRTSEDRKVLLYLAKHMSALRDPKRLIDLDLTSKLKQPRAKSWLSALAHLIAKDKSGFDRNILSLVDDFKNKDFGNGRSRVIVSWDASILVSLGELRNDWTLTCSHEVADFVLARDSLAVK